MTKIYYENERKKIIIIKIVFLLKINIVAVYLTFNHTYFTMLHEQI